MLKSTIYLFFEALIIGVLVILSLQYAAGISAQADKTPTVHIEQHLPAPVTQP
jgi:hypothetical protein